MSHQLNRSGQAFVWSRAYSPDQIRKVGEVARFRRRFPPSLQQATRFARCQVRCSVARPSRHRCVEGLWDGERVLFDLDVRPLFLDHAQLYYERAARAAQAAFPGFQDHAVEDGPAQGERRLSFTNASHDLALPFMVGILCRLARDKAVRIGESATMTPLAAAAGTMRTVAVSVALDRPAIAVSDIDALSASLEQGLPLPIDQQERPCDPALIFPTIAVLSLPELVYLNWAEVRKHPGAAELGLLAAARALDAAALGRHLADGADPNILSEGGRSALFEVVAAEAPADDPGADDRRRLCLRALLDAGADVDCHGPDEVTPLAMAILRRRDDLTDWLLGEGADDAIKDLAADPSEWPTAWDWAASERTVAALDRLEDAERVWRVLRARRQAPDGTRPGERPEW